MRITPNNNINTSFGLIKLNSIDLNQSEKLLKDIAKPTLNLDCRNSFAIELYKIFLPYLKEETKLKAKSCYIREEVFSDIKLKFWEFIYELNDKNVIDDLIKIIDKYHPKKILSRFKYSERSLDDCIPNTNNKLIAETITQENLPESTSEIDIEDIKNKLESAINNTKISNKIRKRLKQKSKGLSYNKIAAKEGINHSSVINSVNLGILKIQKSNGVISDENKQLISNFANLINTTFDEALNIVSKHIQVLRSSNETIKRNIDTFVKDFKISKSEFTKIATKQPLLFYQKPETINSNIDACAKIFELPREKFINIALKHPQLFSKKPETINENIKKFTELFKISKTEFVKIVLKCPQLFSQKPETLNKNIENSANLFGIPKARFIKLALQHPALFYQNPQTINKNIETAAKVFEISKEEYINAALLRPQLFSSKTKTLNKNAVTTAKKLNISKENYIKIALKRPQILYLKPETINSNMEATAKLLHLSKSSFINAALKQSQLLYQKPETINANIETSAKILGISKTEFVNMALKQPTLFYLKPETLAKKFKIAKYYNMLKQETTPSKISSRRIITSDDEMYKDILVHILQDKYFTTLRKIDIKEKLAELLNKCEDTISVEIPKFDFIDDFIKYAENFSIKSTGNNIFKFVIKE